MKYYQEGYREIAYRMSLDNVWMGLFIDGHLAFSLPIKEFEIFAEATNDALEGAHEELDKEKRDAISGVQMFLGEQQEQWKEASL